MLEGIRDAVRRFLSGSYHERAVDDFLKEIQKELIKSDVNVKLVVELSKRIRERASKEEPPPGVSRKDLLVKIVYEELSSLFGGDREPQVIPPKRPWVILLVGVQGSGKTTTAGKLALYYVRRGYRVGLVSTDTHRPGALQQLKTLAERAGSMFYGEDKGDPAEIAQRGVKELLSRGADLIIVDTAGRHGYGSEEALLREMREIAAAVRPDEIMLVIDAAIGQRAYDLASRFHSSTPIGSIVISKADGSARGGGALSAAAATGASIKFVGTGESLEELEPFRPRRFVARIMGMGDIEGVLERLRAAEELKRAEEAAAKMVSGKVDMRALYAQLKAIRRMGPLAKVMQSLPLSLGSEAIKEAAKMGEEKIDRWIAIIQSMTYEELEDPEIIDRSRMRRIAIGSGTSIEDVKELLAYYKNMVALSKRLRRDRRLLERLGIDLRESGS